MSRLEAAGIPDPSIITDTFTANFPASLFAPDISANGTVEAPVDVEVAHAMAPGAQIVVYQSPEASAFGVNFEEDMLHAVAHPSGIVPRSMQVSSSWFMSGDSDSQQSINAMSSMGQSFFECSGDGGAYTSTSLDIRTFDNVTVVGGTILVSAAAGSAPMENAWAQTGSSSGGGFFGPSAFPIFGNLGTVNIPSYQTAFVNGSNLASATFRNVPDVSMVATNIVGVTTASDGTKGVRGGGFNGTRTSSCSRGLLARSPAAAGRSQVSRVVEAAPRPCLSSVSRATAVTPACCSRTAPSGAWATIGTASSETAPRPSSQKRHRKRRWA